MPSCRRAVRPLPARVTTGQLLMKRSTLNERTWVVVLHQLMTTIRHQARVDFVHGTHQSCIAAGSATRTQDHPQAASISIGSACAWSCAPLWEVVLHQRMTTTIHQAAVDFVHAAHQRKVVLAMQ